MEDKGDTRGREIAEAYRADGKMRLKPHLVVVREPDIALVREVRPLTATLAEIVFSNRNLEDVWRRMMA